MCRISVTVWMRSEAVNDISVSAGQLQKDSEEIQDNSKRREGMEKS